MPRHWDPENLITNGHIRQLCNKNWIPVSRTGMTPHTTCKLQCSHSYVSSTGENTGMTERGLMNQVSKLTELTFVTALAVGNTLLSLNFLNNQTHCGVIPVRDTGIHTFSSGSQCQSTGMT
ncbi:MAG: WPE palindromic element domain-containing protein, partial [Wolbachia sp.]